jgi:hypothetical protein
MAGPVVATAFALGGINFGVAILIVAAIGVPLLVPLWVGVLALALGVAMAALALRLWRGVMLPRSG